MVNIAGKYKATKKTVDGVRFDSTTEADFYERLKEIGYAFEIQQKFLLQEGYTLVGHKTTRPIHYISDFTVHTEQGMHVIDVKGGILTPDFKLKRKMFEYKFGYKLFCIVKCPKMYQDFNGYSMWGKEWIEFELLEKLRKLRKKGEL